MVFAEEGIRFCVSVARNYISRGAKGELDLVGYDGETLTFVEVRARKMRDGPAALPELSVTPDKQNAVVRTAKAFLAERHAADRPCRFDMLAIDNHPAPGAIAQGRVQPANVKKKAETRYNLSISFQTGFS